MRIKSGYLMKEIAKNHVVVPTGKAALDFSGMMTLNETGAFLWRQLEAGTTESELVASLLKDYDTNETTARADISEFLTKLKTADLFE
ncbi:PqqD family protein [Desulfosporosinus sp. FKA]|uniref:PqqD family protein n=1 Tax=Desulfosporosinus sp. FKA TaxID=1969834 RepID=UPI000B49951F|nr:PqqD family protein [Desulfosporosinus sp. FKA]